MRRSVLLLGLLLAYSTVQATTSDVTVQQQAQVTQDLESMLLAFTENQGQWDERVLYRADAGGATMWFTDEGVVYQFTRRISVGQEPCDPDIRAKREAVGQDPRDPDNAKSVSGYKQPDLQTGPIDPMYDDRMDREPEQYESMTIKASFVGANPNPTVRGEDMMEYKCNYFIGNDPNEWHTDVPNYESIVLEDVYDGIDLKYYGNGKQMEYDFIVSPGADFAQIEIDYEGARIYLCKCQRRVSC